jgi:ribosome-binding protein aMBF1 (putative translation factor)
MKSCESVTCEWCEEEPVTRGLKTKVDGKELALCDECNDSYVSGRMKELNRRRN